LEDFDVNEKLILKYMLKKACYLMNWIQPAQYKVKFWAKGEYADST